jgi:enoyl-CoA hydratase/carnithine racemase
MFVLHDLHVLADHLQVFAMPETALGLFPDVGASYFLSRLAGFFGMNIVS